MDNSKLFANIVFIMLCLNTVKCNKYRKMDQAIGVLKEKFSTLEEKLYQDEYDLRLEIDSLWRQLNESKGYYDPVDKPDVTTIQEITDSSSRIDDVDKVLLKVEERSKIMLKSFAEEKATLRDTMEKFENEMLMLRNQQENTLSDLRDASFELSFEINDTLNVRLNKADSVLAQQAAYVKQKQNDTFVALNVSIHEHFDDLKESIIKWNNFSMTSLEKDIDAIEVKQDDTLESFMIKANQMLESFKDTIDDGQKNASTAQKYAAQKAVEFEAMIQTVKDASEECTKRTDNILKSVQYLETRLCLSKDWHVFGNSCYKLSETTATWEKAVEECSIMGAYLAEVDSEEENNYLAKMTVTSQSSYRTVWVGGSDVEIENQWVWQKSKKQLSYQSWRYREPNGRRTENCIELFDLRKHKSVNGNKIKGVWNDGNCSLEYYYVCETTSMV